MHHVVSATTNPAKIQAILQAFDEIFGEGSCHIESVAVESGVPEQPFGSEETRAGARNRVANARLAQPNADFWVAIEAGIDDDSTFSWVVIESASQRGEARSATLPLPDVILEQVRAGEALGPVMSQYTAASIRSVVKRGRLGFSPQRQINPQQRLPPGGRAGAKPVP